MRKIIRRMVRILASVPLLAAVVAASPVLADNLVSGGARDGQIVVPFQKDTYTFAAKQGEYIMLRVADTGTTGNFRPRMRLYDPNGTFVATDAGYTVASLARVADATGIYSLVIADDDINFRGDQLGSYRLNFVRAPGADELGSLINGGTRRDVIDVGDLDSYTFYATQGEYIMLRVADTGTTGNFRPRMRLYDPNGAFVANDAGYTVASLARVADATGVYTVVIADDDINFEGNQAASYRLDFVRAPGADELGSLINGGTRRDVIDVGDLDSYTFYATQGEYIMLRVADTGTTGNFRPRMTLYDPSGAFVANDAGYTVASLARVVGATGVYTVVIADDDINFEGNQAASYRLDFVRAPGADELGSLINGGTRRDVIDVGDLDSYTFYATQGEYIMLRVADTGTTGNFRPRMTLYDPSGAFVANDAGYTVASLARVADATGIYTVVIADDDVNFEGNQAGPYSLEYTNDTDRFSYAALGDSYSSGEGLYPYLNPSDAYLTFPFPLSLLGLDGGCHRSNRAYSHGIRRSGEAVPLVSQPDVQFDFFACTGAETINVRIGGKELHGEPPQLVTENAIDENRDLITITIGGNDAQWSRIIAYCFAHRDCDQIEPFAPHTDITLGELATPLLVGYASVGISDVHQEIRDLAPNAAIVVLGYPNLVSGNECPALALPGVPEAKLSASEQVFLRKANVDLNAVIAASAVNVGLHYIPVADAFSEHETCDPGENWVNGLTPLNLAGSFHPTVRGQREYARLFNEHMQNLSTGWSPGFLPNGLPRNPEPVPALVAQPQVEALALEAELPRFGDLGVIPVAVPEDCRSAQGAVVPGEAVRVRGEGFDPGETVELSLMVNNERISLGDTTADSEGSIVAEVVMPEELAVDTSGTVEALGAGQNGAGLLLMTIVRVEASAVADNDDDGLADICDNCSATSNADQRDTDRDGYGNMCDADLDNNGIVNTLDLAKFKASFGASDHALDADLDGNFVVNTLDLARFKSLFGKAPGPAFTTP